MDFYRILKNNINFKMKKLLLFKNVLFFNICKITSFC